MSVKVLLADDHAMFRTGLRLLLESHGGFEIVGEASDGREAVRLAAELKPEVAVMDIAMPLLNGIEATRRIARRCPDLRVVMLSMFSTAEHVHQALAAGASGYVLKECAPTELIEALDAVLGGQRFLSDRLPADLRQAALADPGAGSIASPLDSLSGRERETVQLVVEGKSSAQIAESLFLSRTTVETYRCRIMKKLAVPDVPSLVKFAIQHGLTPLP